MSAILQYLLNWAIWLDEGLNTALGGDPGETLSSRAGKAARRGRAWGCILCKVLGWINTNHCEKAINLDDGKRAVIPDGE
ncbi:MAG TPA: hypothetical protein VJ840_18735 [Gemmatimonadaceae bacterium]|nr:hypothetical protein [Gemmatimonadaceae bacterium]